MIVTVVVVAVVMAEVVVCVLSYTIHIQGNQGEIKQ
jgi:hypothetical protein